jgi:hypothetical protein
MDPDATLAQLIQAVRDEDADAYKDALTALFEWDSNGGYMPTVVPVLQEQNE